MITAQERRIARDLSIIYLAYGAVVTGMLMTSDWWGSLPQWITATVAVFAVVVAAVGIGVQRTVARRRAAIDFFIKTEMDQHLIDAYDDFWMGIDSMKEHIRATKLDEFCGSKDKDIRKHYFAVRKYLNVHELVAVGIKDGMLDGKICHDFWSGVLIRCVEAARPVLDHVRRRPGGQLTYSELETLYGDWKRTE